MRAINTVNLFDKQNKFEKYSALDIKKIEDYKINQI